jgi:hypothetical protein
VRDGPLGAGVQLGTGYALCYNLTQRRLPNPRPKGFFSQSDLLIAETHRRTAVISLQKSGLPPGSGSLAACSSLEKYRPAPGLVPQAGSLLLAILQLGHLGLAADAANTQGRPHLEVERGRELQSTCNGCRGQSELMQSHAGAMRVPAGSASPA